MGGVAYGHVPIQTGGAFTGVVPYCLSLFVGFFCERCSMFKGCIKRFVPRYRTA